MSIYVRGSSGEVKVLAYILKVKMKSIVSSLPGVLCREMTTEESHSVCDNVEHRVISNLSGSGRKVLKELR